MSPRRLHPWASSVSDVVIRRRQDADLPALVDILTLQQAQTHYPVRWPWDGDLADFVRRPSELEAWVAEVDGVVAGHVAVQTVDDDELGRLGSVAHERPVDRLRCIGVLFADRRLPRRGIGSALLARATQQALLDGGAPVLDVVAGHREPVQLYRSRGWREVGRFRPDWLPDGDEPVLVMILPRPTDDTPVTG